MSGRQFLDTNVLVYSCDSSDVGKQQTALDLIAACSSQGTGVLSVQVLGEFFHATVVRKKLLAADEAERAILAFRAAMPVVSVEIQDVADAIAIHRKYQTRYFLSIASDNRFGDARHDYRLQRRRSTSGSRGTDQPTRRPRRLHETSPSNGSGADSHVEEETHPSSNHASGQGQSPGATQAHGTSVSWNSKQWACSTPGWVAVAESATPRPGLRGLSPSHPAALRAPVRHTDAPWI